MFLWGDVCCEEHVLDDACRFACDGRDGDRQASIMWARLAIQD